MALHLHRAPRTDLLADALGELLAVPGADPFTEEVVVVPARGVERWLTQRLSHRLGVGSAPGSGGVCAGVRFLTPPSLISLLLGRERDDVWNAERLVWPLLATIDVACGAGDPRFAVLARHLGFDGSPGSEQRRDRRWSVAWRLAHLFSSYATYRPALITDWREGRDLDGAGAPLPGDLDWQAELWRRLLAHLRADGVEAPDQRHARVVAALRSGTDVDPAPGRARLTLPGRLSLFGHTRISATEADLLHALAQRRDVHLWLPQASASLWEALGSLPGPSGAVPRTDDPSVEAVGHPLLASLGRDGRELRRTLAPLLADAASDEAIPGDETGAPTLLGWLQGDLRDNRLPGEAERAARVVAVGDRSLQVHACHGATRQVDVLREVLVGLLADDPTLEPRDILVMCPDVETFAPLVSAGFGLADPVAAITPDDEVIAGPTHPAHRLRVRLADRALVATNPLLQLAAGLVELAGGRVTASAVLDLAGSAPCRRRFGFGDDDLDRIARWIRASGVRWGLDAAWRSRYAMQGFGQNTWRAGLDRVLLGVVMSGDEHRHLGRGLPLDDVGSSDVDLAGRLAELLDRLESCLLALDAATHVGEWMRALGDGVRGLVAVAPDDAWQLPQLERELAKVAAAGAASEGGVGPVGSSATMRLADVRALLGAQLGGRPTRANFRTGTLTVCTMVPMRSVPHRVVCLLGLDDGVFPRVNQIDGDDVLARHPRTGERDARSEDRQLLLDAILAATETLVVTYSGADEHSGAPRPPAVPLGEILDAAERTAVGPDGASGVGSLRAHVETRHPLQPHDVRNLAAGVLVADRPPGRERPFSFDTAALAGARAAVGERHAPPPLLAAPLPAREQTDDVSLADLTAFFAHPARAFLRDRLRIGTLLDPDEVDDAIPVTLDALEAWGVGDRLLTEVLAGSDATAVLLGEQLRGSLPPGELGTSTLRKVSTEAQALLNRTAELRDGEQRALDVDVVLPGTGGRRVTGTVTGLHGTRLVSLGYSRLKARQRLTAWIELLALSATYPDEHFTSHAVGREKAGPKRALAGPVDHSAAERLTELVALRDAGLRAPLPVPVATACAFAEARLRAEAGQDVDPVEMARRAWTTDPHNSWGITGEDADAWNVRAHGEHAPLETLLDAGLAESAWALWSPLLTGAERVAAL